MKQNDELERWYTRIPNTLIKRGKLTYKELALYTYYKSFAGDNGYCNVTIRNVAKDLGMSSTTVIETRDSLINKKYIELEQISPRKFFIFIVDIWQENEDDFQKYKDVPKEKHHVPKSDI